MSARQEQLLQAQKTVEQLRLQANLERTKVSVSSKSLLEYVQENEADDPLVNSFGNQDNPFKPKTPCIIV